MAAAWAGLTPAEASAPWRAVTPSQRPASGVGQWAIAVRIDPKKAALIEKETALQVGGESSRIRWLSPASAPTAAERSLIDHTVPRPLSPLRSAGLWLATRSPQTRWRARLVAGNFTSPAAPFEAVSLDDLPELLARQTEAGWRAAFQTLEAADPSLARDLAARLITSADFPSAPGAPAWPAAPPGIVESILAADSRASLPIDRIRLWLSMQPEAIAWVIDDAGARDLITDGVLSTIGVANLITQPAAASAAAESPAAPAAIGVAGEQGGGAAPGAATDLAALAPFTAARVTASSATPDLRAAGPHLGARLAHEGLDAHVTIGAASIRRRLFPIPQPVLPPGARIGPLLPDWTMSDWLAQGADDPEATTIPATRALLDPAWITVGLIHRGSIGASAAASPSRPDPWQIYLELAQLRDPLAPSNRASETGHIRIWLGPFGAPTAVLRVLADGTVRDESGSAFTLPPRAAAVAAEGRRWSAWVPLPSGAIEPDGILRIGIERTDARGVRSAWPRPMLPWQIEPGRAALDTSAWAAPSE